VTQEARTWTTSGGGTASDTVGYSYTDDGQLTGVTHTNGSFSGESFSYDANGNRTMSGYGTDTGNRLDDDGAYTYEYDDEGNLITRTETASGAYREFDYDHRNRLTSVTDKTSGGSVTSQVTYTYDALDRRIKIDDGTDVLKVAYDGQAVILDFDGSNNQTARYLPGPMIDELLARETGGGTVAWYLQDRLNTVRDLADNTGAIINHIDYDAFGAVVAESAPGVGDRFKFTGRELDEATGLQYHRARHYDPAAGRWTQEDPIGFAAGDANLYRYVGNGPTNASDPSGLQILGDPPSRSSLLCGLPSSEIYGSLHPLCTLPEVTLVMPPS
jgi:RHS repeat-associated protein